MKQRFRHLIQALYIAVVFFITAIVSEGYSNRVLVLNAYHEGYHWTDRTVEGIKSVMSDEQEVELFISYMDTKHCSDQKYYERLRDLYAHKYQQIQFDAIISCDDHALDFLLQYRDELFPGVPVVFCGINDFHPDRISGHEGFAGICETYDVSGTVEMMLSLHEATEEIYIITDATLSGHYFLNLVKRAEPEFEGRVAFNYLTNPEAEILKKTLSELPEKALVLWAIYMRRPDGSFISCRESMRMVTESSSRPVYCIWDVVGQGVVGGKVTSPNYQGETVAGLALDVLRGGSVESMGVSESPMIYLFDDEVLGRLDIAHGSLPENSIIMNRPFSIYAEYMEIIWLIIGFFLILLSIILLLIRDILKRRRMEIALLESKDQLRQSEKMSVLGQLAGGIAHDFNNQLAGVVGYADLMLDQLEEGELREFALGVKKSALRSADLTSQLLAFSRRGKYLAVPVDLHELIRDVEKMLKHSIDKRIRLELRLDALPSITSGDPTQLQNAILNMALNARDAMPDGGELIFETRNLEVDKEFSRGRRYELTPGPYINLNISDSGSGMDKETLHHIFEPFYTTKDLGKGTGMGLASVYGTVKNHQGAIEAHSEPCEGTVMKIYLPQSVKEDQDRDIQNETSGVPVQASGRILLADDEAVVRDMAQNILQSLGYTVTVCKNGKEAVDCYQKNGSEIDLVILDMVMPEMNGKEVYAALKSINSGVRVILSSGYSIDGDTQEILDNGVKAFIEKPYGKAELAEVVAGVLGGKNMQGTR